MKPLDLRETRRRRHVRFCDDVNHGLQAARQLLREELGHEGGIAAGRLEVRLQFSGRGRALASVAAVAGRGRDRLLFAALPLPVVADRCKKG